MTETIHKISPTATWPTTDREWARSHRGCNVTTCPNGKCRATGECIDQAAFGPDALDSAIAILKGRPSVESPSIVPLAPGYEQQGSGYDSGAVGYELQGRASAPPSVPFPDLDDRTTHELILDRDVALAAIANGEYSELPPLGDSRRPVTPRTIIAFTGLAGAGKSTAAAHLVRRRGFQRVRFAGPLKAMMIALGCTTEQVDGSLKETPCDLLCGKTPRQAMQWLGTEFGRDLIGRDLWIRAWQAAVAKVPAGVPVVVDDCRFPNEASAVTAAGGILVRVERPAAGAPSVHASEQHALPAARTLHNTLDQRNLWEQVDVMLRDLSWVDRDAPL